MIFLCLVAVGDQSELLVERNIKILVIVVRVYSF